MKFAKLLGAFAVAATMGASASAADLPSRKAAVAPAPVFVDTFHPFQILLRASVVIPQVKSSVYDSWGMIPGVAGVSGGYPGTQIWGAGVKPSTSVIPEIDISYYFTKNIAIEAICCVSPHKLNGTGLLSGLNVGKTWVFPPTIMLQYHFTNFGAFQPYVGVGVNFSAFFGTKAGSNWAPFYTGIGQVGYNTVTSLSVGSSWGLAGQVGFDYMINDRWGVNVDVKRIMMRPTATGVVYNSGLNAFIPIRAKVNIDPWVVSAGLTYRFGGGAAAPIVAKY